MICRSLDDFPVPLVVNINGFSLDPEVIRDWVGYHLGCNLQ